MSQPPTDFPVSPVTAWGYVRVSTDGQFDRGNGILTYSNQIIAFAEQRGYNLGPLQTRNFGAQYGELPTRRHIVYESDSARKIPFAKRPQAAKLLAEMRPGEVLILNKLDRMFRTVEDCLITLRNLAQRNIGVIILDLGGDQIDMRNHTGKVLIAMLAVMAEYASDLTSDRVRDACRTRKANGLANGGQQPLLFRRTVETKPAAKGQTASYTRLLPDREARRHAQLFHQLYQAKRNVSFIVRYAADHSLFPVGNTDGRKYSHASVTALINAETKIRQIAQEMGVDDDDERALYEWWRRRQSFSADRSFSRRAQRPAASDAGELRPDLMAGGGDADHGTAVPVRSHAVPETQ